MSAGLLELQVELLNSGSVFIDFENIIDCLKAVLSGDWKTLDAIAKGSDNSTKKKLNTEEEKCVPVVYCIIRNNVKESAGWIIENANHWSTTCVKAFPLTLSLVIMLSMNV